MMQGKIIAVMPEYKKTDNVQNCMFDKVICPLRLRISNTHYPLRA